MWIIIEHIDQMVYIVDEYSIRIKNIIRLQKYREY